MNYKSYTFLFFVSFSIFCINQANTQTIKSDLFKEVFKEFPRQEKNLRKWDAPVVADLDKDGYLDLLINDHGYGIQVCWNNKGKFTKPYDIIMGDIHGVSVGDIDFDGNLEVIMSRGGGSGSNARNSKIYTVRGRDFVPLKDFKEPLAMMRGRTVDFIDINNDGYLDLLNFAFPDGAKKGATENYIYENDKNGQLILNSTLPASKIDGQKVLVTDFNGDNILDVVMYGYGNVKMYKGGEGFVFEDVTKKILPHNIDEVTGVAEIDYDNDGDFDLYFTRGLEFKKGETFYDKETKTFAFYTKRGELKIDDIETGDILEMENFQSQWPNNDTYYLGETSYNYEFKGETHSGKDIRLVNSDALGFPDNANYKEKKGWYIGYVGNRKWRIAGYLWAPATGIVHGVKNYPKYNHPKGLEDILLENKGNKFKDVSKKANILFKEHSMAATIADFDNNGFQDILVVPRGNLVNELETIIFLNKGDATFEKIRGHNMISKELGAIGMAVENLDYNNDGKVDVVLGNERGKWHLFKNTYNQANKNNFAIVNVGTSPSGKATGLGALVTLKQGKSKLVKRVGTTGSQYSLSFNNLVHFGVGASNSAVKVKVTWSNGETTEKTISTLNKIVKVGI